MVDHHATGPTSEWSEKQSANWNALVARSLAGRTLPATAARDADTPRTYSEYLPETESERINLAKQGHQLT